MKLHNELKLSLETYMFILKCNVMVLGSIWNKQVMDPVHVHFMSIVDKMFAIYIDTVKSRGNFNFDEKGFSLIKGEVRDISLLFLPTTAILGVSHDSIFALPGVEMESHIVAVSFTILLKVDCKPEIYGTALQKS